MRSAAQAAALDEEPGGAPEPPDGLLRTPDSSGEPLEGPGIVVFQLGGAVLAAGVEWERVERKVRDRLYRYGEMSLARKLPFEDRPLDLRNVRLRVWGEDRAEIGALYRAWCSEALVDRVVRGARLEVPWDTSPGEPVELALREARTRLTLTGPAEDAAEAASLPAPVLPAPAQPLRPRPFTVRDVLELRPFDREAIVPPEAARKAAAIATSRLLSVLGRAELADRARLEPLWLAKAARALRQASEALELALDFGKAEARAEARP